jgi:hypothetical protein
MEDQISQLKTEIRELTDLIPFMQGQQIPFSVPGYHILINQLLKLRIELATKQAEVSRQHLRQITEN